VGRVAEAEEAYGAALKLVPGDPVAHGSYGEFLENQGRCQEAEAEFNEAIQFQPEQSWFWALRGGAYADQGQWEKAAADFVQATQCKEPDADDWYAREMLNLRDGEAWYAQALLHLREGNLGGYRQICADLLERFGGEATWTCTLSPNSGADPNRVVDLAEKVLAKSSRDHWHVTQLGAALYRARHFEEAVKQLTEATELSAGPYQTNMLCTWFFLAMAHHRFGHAEEANRWLEKASRITMDILKTPAKSSEKSSGANGTVTANWAGKLVLELLLSEAEQLIQRPNAKPGE
jgi:tetratricopeptide (TPR) repeat protein